MKVCFRGMSVKGKTQKPAVSRTSRPRRKGQEIVLLDLGQEDRTPTPNQRPGSQAMKKYLTNLLFSPLAEKICKIKLRGPK